VLTKANYKYIVSNKVLPNAQRRALPAKAGIGGKMPKGKKSQWCESTQKRRTTPLLSGTNGVGLF